MTSHTQSTQKAFPEATAAFNLFAAMILADGRVVDAECRTLDRVWSSLTTRLNSPAGFIPDLTDAADHVDDPAWLAAQLAVLDGPHHQTMLQALWELAVADNVLDPREDAILDTAIRSWRERYI